MGIPWEMVNAELFEQLVKQGIVQYLVWENNGIKCKYTDEEKKCLKKGPVNQKFVEETEKNYFNLDCTFKYKHICAVVNGSNVMACSVADLTTVFGQMMNMVYAYANQSVLANMVSVINVNMPTLSPLITVSGNVAKILLPLNMIEPFFVKLNANNIMALFDTSTIKFIANHGIDTPRIKIIQKRITPQSRLYLASTYDKMTEKTEKILNI